VVERFHDLVTGVAGAMGCKAAVAVKKLTPAVVNDEKVTSMVKQAVSDALPDALLDETYQSMVSEDMAYMLEKAPGCFVLVGSGFSEKEKNFSHHHPRFNINEDVLPRAAAAITASALEILKRG
jgi:amidohydrolase